MEGGGIKLLGITDGTSNTIMVGEKHVPQGQFGTIWSDYSAYNGSNPVSWTRRADPGAGLAQSLRDPAWKFGSYHVGGCNFAFCDGRVQTLSHLISPDILALLADRADGNVIPPY